MFGVRSGTGLGSTLPERTTPLKTYSPKDVIEDIYGPAPKRGKLPTRYVKRTTAATVAEGESSPEESLERERWLVELGQVVETTREELADESESDTVKSWFNKSWFGGKKKKG